MDCRTARHYLPFDRGPSELDQAERRLLESHLAVCADCDAQFRAERQLDAHLGRAVRDVPVPRGLQKRLLSSLARQRDDWYRRWLGRCVRVAAVAAVVLVGIYFGIYWRKQNLPRLDVETVAQDALQPSYSPPTRDDAEARFRKGDATVLAPENFNYQFLTSYSMGEFMGRRTPMLLFRSDRTTAEVYILSREHYDLSALPTVYEPEEHGYRFRVLVWTPRRPGTNEDAGHVYVIRYTGDLDELLREPIPHRKDGKGRTTERP